MGNHGSRSSHIQSFPSDSLGETGILAEDPLNSGAEEKPSSYDLATNLSQFYARDVVAACKEATANPTFGGTQLDYTGETGFCRAIRSIPPEK
jgi:hypothetical protein